MFLGFGTRFGCVCVCVCVCVCFTTVTIAHKSRMQYCSIFRQTLVYALVLASSPGILGLGPGTRLMHYMHLPPSLSLSPTPFGSQHSMCCGHTVCTTILQEKAKEQRQARRNNDSLTSVIMQCQFQPPRFD